MLTEQADLGGQPDWLNRENIRIHRLVETAGGPSHQYSIN
jgi:hypothetical protein